MFKSEEMQRIRVYSDKGKLNALIAALYEFGAIQVTQARHSFLKEYGQTLESFKDISTALINLRSVEQILALQAPHSKIDGSLEQLLQQYSEMNVEQVVSLNVQLETLMAKEVELQKRIADLAPAALFNLAAKFDQLKSISFSLFTSSVDPQLVKSDFAKIPNTSISTRDVKGTRLYLAAFQRDAGTTEAVVKTIARHAEKTIAIPQIATGSYADEVETLNTQLSEVGKTIKKIEAELREIKRNYGEKMVSLRQALEIESQKAQLPFKFSATANLVIVEAWIPKKYASVIEAELNQKARDNSHVHVELLQTAELAPTKLANMRGISAFQELVKFFSLPKSSELDPTVLVAISFPLFFGMIVGDIGYGIVSLLAALYVKNKMKGEMLQAIGTMLAVSAVSSIFFGYVFGEFFGFEHIFGYELHPLIHRAEEEGLQLLMALSILFGMVHLAIGYILGAYQAFEHRHFKHGYAKLSWLVLEFSLALFVAGTMEISFLHFIQPLAEVITPSISLPLLIASIVGIAVFEGPISVIFETPGLLSNIFSYLRIMALGVSGVIIALILNKITESLTFSTPIGVITSLLLLALFVVGHIGSLALALFESMIQSMRLQYVEFFSKFFEGGGVPFTPLKPGKY